MSHVFKGYQLPEFLLNDDEANEAPVVVTVEPDIIDENAIGILTTIEELTVGPLDEVRTFTSYRKVGKSRVKRKTRVIFQDDARGFSGGELHQLYGGKSPGASATTGSLFDPARYRPR